MIAENTWAAIKGREALKIDWNDGPNGTFNSKSHYETLAAASKEPGKTYRNVGDVESALKSATKVITAEYYVPHLAHATMEPLAATASYADGKCEVWAPTQSPQAAHDYVVKRLGLKDEDVKVNVTLVGGGFGRKSKCDFVVEAAVLSKAMGAPVKVVWTRDDDLQHDYYHASGFERLDAGLEHQQQGHRVATPGALRKLPDDLRRWRRSHGPVSPRLRRQRHALQRPELADRVRQSRGAYAYRLVPVGLQRPARLREFNPLSRNWRMRLERTPRTTCLN